MTLEVGQNDFKLGLWELSIRLVPATDVFQLVVKNRLQNSEPIQRR